MPLREPLCNGHHCSRQDREQRVPRLPSPSQQVSSWRHSEMALTVQGPILTGGHTRASGAVVRSHPFPSPQVRRWERSPSPLWVSLAQAGSLRLVCTFSCPSPADALGTEHTFKLMANAPQTPLRAGPSPPPPPRPQPCACNVMVSERSGSNGSQKADPHRGECPASASWLFKP